MRSMLQRVVMVMVVATFSAPTGVHGQSIFTNAITDANPSAANPFTTGQVVNSSITASGIGRGPGITANPGSNRYNAASWTTTATIDLTDYFTWTLTPASGNAINFTNFVYTGQASGSGPTAFNFRSSLDNFTANIGSPTAGGTTIDLSAPIYQTVTAPVEFRFYGFGNTSGTAAGTYSVNDFTYNGTVTPAPEPASVLAIGAATAGAVGYLRRRMRATV